MMTFIGNYCILGNTQGLLLWNRFGSVCNLALWMNKGMSTWIANILFLAMAVRGGLVFELRKYLTSFSENLSISHSTQWRPKWKSSWEVQSFLEIVCLHGASKALVLQGLLQTTQLTPQLYPQHVSRPSH